MKAFKLELLVIDFDNIGEDAIIYGIENASYANDCINPSVKNIVCRDIGEWNDDLEHESILNNFKNDYINIPSVFFLVASELRHISSSAIRQLVKLGKNVDQYIVK